MKKKTVIEVLNNFENYVAAVLFMVVCILLTTQVITRYCFNHAITWAEEVATMLFVPMIYCGVSGAVTHRKHINIDIVQTLAPFKVSKALRIFSDVVFIAFCFAIQGPFHRVILTLQDSVFPLTQFQKKYFYWMVPILLMLTAIRLVQDIVRLWKEDKENLGKKKPTIDLDACEQEARERGLIK